MVRVCSSCKGKLGLFMSANSGSTTKKWEHTFFPFLSGGEHGFFVLRGNVDSHFDATLKGV